MNDLFDSPVRYLITPGSLIPSNFHAEKDSLLETIRLAVSAGIELVQVREKSLSGKQLFEFAAAAVEIAGGTGTRIMVNERFDIAIAAGADGVHLTSRSIPAAEVRANVPDDFLIGVSVHRRSEVEAARNSGADLALFGPVFATPGKGDLVGLDGFRSVCRETAPFPVIGIGGIDGSNADSVLNAGAAGYAAIRYLNEFVKMAR